ncbi:MAG TPA: hypothetical protein VK832_19800, partial [Burkholderiaceae bacterium]|nr:hypothetical protein [Burkholderiaceae bacterium]
SARRCSIVGSIGYGIVEKGSEVKSVRLSDGIADQSQSECPDRMIRTWRKYASLDSVSQFREILEKLP